MVDDTAALSLKQGPLSSVNPVYLIDVKFDNLGFSLRLRQFIRSWAPFLRSDPVQSEIDHRYLLHERLDVQMNPSPIMNLSPEPSFVSGFGGSFDDVLDKSFPLISQPSTPSRL